MNIFRRRVKSMPPPRLAAQQPFYSKPRTLANTVDFDALLGIDGAAGMKTAVVAYQWREDQTIQFDHKQEK